MAESLQTYRFGHALAFLIWAGVIAFFQLLPMGDRAGGLPGPDLLLLGTFCWGMRRPDLIPTPLVAVVFLIADVLFMRPLGLWAGLVVIAFEVLRSRSTAWRELNFLLEWLMVSGLIVGVTFANAAVLTVFVVDQASLGMTLIRLIVTIAFYPVVALILIRFLGLRKLAPGAVDRLGHRQ